VFSYLWKQLNSPNRIRAKQIRMYNALIWQDYNLETRELMWEQNGCRVIVATDILMVGVDFPDIDNVVIIGRPPNVNDYLQKVGRAGRDRALVPNPCGIVYLTDYARKSAYGMLGIEPPTAKPKKGGVKSKPSDGPKKRCAKKHKTLDTDAPTIKSSMSEEMAKLIVSKCKTTELDTVYGNPSLQSSVQCHCSGCVPTPEMPKKRPQRQPKGEARLTKEMKELATKRFIELREEIYLATDLKVLTDPFLVLP